MKQKGTKCLCDVFLWFARNTEWPGTRRKLTKQQAAALLYAQVAATNVTLMDEALALDETTTINQHCCQHGERPRLSSSVQWRQSYGRSSTRASW